jgi:lysophospholipase L1-like esterase
MREHREKIARAIERLGGGAPQKRPETCVAMKPAAGKPGFRVLETAAGAVAVSGFDDTIQEALGRVENGELDAVKAKAVALMLGTNNQGCPPAEMAEGMRGLVEAIRRRRPDLKILIYASFPCRRTWSDLRNRASDALYAKIADGRTVLFRDINANLPLSFFPDGLHPNEQAMAVWIDDLAKCL